MYEATTADLLFGMGGLMLDDGMRAPIIQVHYSSWTRDMLDLVRDTFAGGIEIRAEQQSAGRADVVLARRQLITIGARTAETTDALRAPAWDARLRSIDLAVIGAFEFERHASGGFLRIVRSHEWEFLASVMLHGSCQIMPIQARSFPMPSTIS
jgi:hypothetical protein